MKENVEKNHEEKWQKQEGKGEKMYKKNQE